MAVVQTAESLPGGVLVQPDQTGDDGAPRDPVRGDDSTLPRAQVGQEVIDRKPGAVGNLAQDAVLAGLST